MFLPGTLEVANHGCSLRTQLVLEEAGAPAPSYLITAVSRVPAGPEERVT